MKCFKFSFFFFYQAGILSLLPFLQQEFSIDLQPPTGLSGRVYAPNLFLRCWLEVKELVGPNQAELISQGNYSVRIPQG